MKGLRSTLALLAVLAGLGAYIYFVTWKQPSTPDSGKKLEKVFNASSDKIDEIKITSTSGESTTARKEGSAWKLVEPVAAAADESEISGIVNAVSTADMVRVVEENPGTLNDYGLSTPGVEIAFKAAGDKDYHRLFLGEKTPTGGDVFARRDNDKKVFLIAAFQETSLNKSAFDLRDKSLLKVDREKIDSVDLNAGSQAMTIAKDGNEWKIRKPIETRADYGSVEGLVGRLQSARMKSLVSDNASP